MDPDQHKDAPMRDYMIDIQPTKQTYSSLISKHVITASSEELFYSGTDIKMLDDIRNWKKWE